MAEQVKSITDARQGLPGLSHNAGKRMERYIITQQGQPQSVLLGYKDYQGMVAAVELLHQPAALANLHRGLQQLREGEGLTFEEMEAAVERTEANDIESYTQEQDVEGSLARTVYPLKGMEGAPAAYSEATAVEAGMVEFSQEPVQVIHAKPISKTIEIPEFGNIDTHSRRREKGRQCESENGFGTANGIEGKDECSPG